MNTEVRKDQLKTVFEAFSEAPICRYVATMRKADSIFFVRKGFCAITKHTANYLTTAEAYRPQPDWRLF